MNSLLRISAGLLLLTTVASAQLLPEPPARSNPSDLPIPSSLYEAWIERGLPLEVLRERVGRGFITVDDARRIHVELVGPKGSLAVSDAFVRSFGGVPDTRWRHRVDTWIPLDRLIDLTRALPAGHRLERPSAGLIDDVTGEGPAVMGSDAWRDGGADGSGKTIAIIDIDWSGLTAAGNNGDLPGSYVKVNFTPSVFESGPTPHGTACTETVFDHASGASYRLYKIDSTTDIFDVVKNCTDNGVDIISRSLTKFNDGWWDEEGEFPQAVTEACNAGILWVNSAGNYQQTHWEGFMDPGQGSPDWHDWVSGDEMLGVTLADGATLNLYLSWDDDPSGSEDYDLYLYDVALNQIASSTNANEDFEALTWTNSSSNPVTVNIGVYRFSGAAVDFEIFGSTGMWEYQVASGSVAASIASTHPNLVVVGAVDQSNFNSPAGTSGIVMGYSSLGPSNSGKPVVDISGPTNTASFSYPGASGFGGTSCATPNVAGLAACLWSSTPAYNAGAIRWLVHRQGEVYRDWGTGGFDHTYGFGGANLIDFAPDTRWLTKKSEYKNGQGSPTGPVNSLTHAVAQVPTGGRVVAFPGGNFHQASTTLPHVLNKAMTLVSRGATAVFEE